MQPVILISINEMARTDNTFFIIFLQNVIIIIIELLFLSVLIKVHVIYTMTGLLVQ